MSTSPARSSAVVSSGTVTIGGIDWPQAGAVARSLQVNGTLILGDSTVVDPSTLDQLTVDGTLTSFSGEVVTAGNLTLASGSDLEGPGSLTVTGAATLPEASLGVSGDLGDAIRLVLKGASTVTSEFIIRDGSVLENEGTLTLLDSTEIVAGDSGSDQLINDPGATVTYTGSTATRSATVSAPTTNNGTVVCGEGTLVLGSLTNLSAGGTLTGGAYTTAGGVISLSHAVIANAAAITLGAAPSEFTSAGANFLPSLQTNSGSLDLKQSLTLSGALANSGTVTVEAGTLELTSFTQTAGTTTVGGGTALQASSGSGTVTVNAGTLTGTGEIQGNLTGAGNVTPHGTVAGPMTVTGSYDGAGGTLTIPVSGTSTAGIDYGQLSAIGPATLGGTLTFSTASGFLPPVGTQYTIVSAASVSGKYTTINGALLGDRRYALSYTPTTVVATVVPLPPTVTGVTPTGGPPAGGTKVTITGTHFVASATVHFGASAGTSVTLVSATKLTAIAPSGSPGSVDVTVTTPGGGTSKTSAKDLYAYGPPSLASFAPSSATTGSKVTILGTGFAAGVKVVFGTLASPSVAISSGTKIIAVVPNGAVAGAITVTNASAPSGTVTSPTAFTVT